MTLQANNIRCTRQQNTLFADLSFCLQPGEIILVEGDNGSGKSSLLRLLVGLSTPDAGAVLWQGDCIQATREEFVKHLHYVGHTNGVKLGLTVWENLQLAGCLSSFRVPDQVRHAESSATLQSLGLSEYANTPAKHLSAGQQRKIAIAKLFMFPKSLWILDEPLTALDATSQKLFITTLEAHLKQGGMCVMTSHHAIHFQHITPTSLRLSS